MSEEWELKEGAIWNGFKTAVKKIASPITRPISISNLPQGTPQAMAYSNVMRNLANLMNQCGANMDLKEIIRQIAAELETSVLPMLQTAANPGENQNQNPI